MHLADQTQHGGHWWRNVSGLKLAEILFDKVWFVWSQIGSKMRALKEGKKTLMKRRKENETVKEQSNQRNLSLTVNSPSCQNVLIWFMRAYVCIVCLIVVCRLRSYCNFRNQRCLHSFCVKTAESPRKLVSPQNNGYQILFHLPALSPLSLSLQLLSALYMQ